MEEAPEALAPVPEGEVAQAEALVASADPQRSEEEVLEEEAVSSYPQDLEGNS